MQIYLIRHTTVNVPQGLCYGRSEVLLAKSFEGEASAILQKLSDMQFNLVISSPSQRCQFLAKRIPSWEYKIDDRLLELNFGEWELKNWNDLQGEYVNKWMNDFINLPCPGGESYLDMKKRVIHFWSEISICEIENVCIITHGGVIRTILSLLKDDSPTNMFKEQIPFGEILKIGKIGNTFATITLNH